MKTLVTWFFSCFFVLSSLSAEIIETPHFREILTHVTPETLVLLDIDDTLLLPKQTLGVDAWFQYRIKQNTSSGLGHSEAFEKALNEWRAVRHLTQVQVVEEDSVDIVADLQNRGIKVFALTTQGLGLATRTAQQLVSLGFDLTKTAPASGDFFSANPGFLFRDGILFTSGGPKGDCLLELCKLIGYCPSRVVFINDKESHLKDVEQALAAKGIPFVGLRYSYSDQRLAAFSPEIADIQWRYSTFEHILSDEEARELLQK